MFTVAFEDINRSADQAPYQLKGGRLPIQPLPLQEGNSAVVFLQDAQRAAGPPQTDASKPKGFVIQVHGKAPLTLGPSQTKDIHTLTFILEAYLDKERAAHFLKSYTQDVRGSQLAGAINHFLDRYQLVFNTATSEQDVVINIDEHHNISVKTTYSHLQCTSTSGASLSGEMPGTITFNMHLEEDGFAADPIECSDETLEKMFKGTLTKEEFQETTAGELYVDSLITNNLSTIGKAKVTEDTHAFFSSQNENVRALLGLGRATDPKQDNIQAILFEAVARTTFMSDDQQLLTQSLIAFISKKQIPADKSTLLQKINGINALDEKSKKDFTDYVNISVNFDKQNEKFQTGDVSWYFSAEQCKNARMLLGLERAQDETKDDIKTILTEANARDHKTLHKHEIEIAKGIETFVLGNQTLDDKKALAETMKTAFKNDLVASNYPVASTDFIDHINKGIILDQRAATSKASFAFIGTLFSEVWLAAKQGFSFVFSTFIYNPQDKQIKRPTVAPLASLQGEKTEEFIEYVAKDNAADIKKTREQIAATEKHRQQFEAENKNTVNELIRSLSKLAHAYNNINAAQLDHKKSVLVQILKSLDKLEQLPGGDYSTKQTATTILEHIGLKPLSQEQEDRHLDFEQRADLMLNVSPQDIQNYFNFEYVKDPLAFKFENYEGHYTTKTGVDNRWETAQQAFLQNNPAAANIIRLNENLSLAMNIFANKANIQMLEDINKTFAKIKEALPKGVIYPTLRVLEERIGEINAVVNAYFAVNFNAKVVGLHRMINANINLFERAKDNNDSKKVLLRNIDRNLQELRKLYPVDQKPADLIALETKVQGMKEQLAGKTTSAPAARPEGVVVVAAAATVQKQTVDNPVVHSAGFSLAIGNLDESKLRHETQAHKEQSQTTLGNTAEDVPATSAISSDHPQAKHLPASSLITNKSK